MGGDQSIASKDRLHGTRLLRSWVRRSERDQGLRAGPTTHDGRSDQGAGARDRELASQ